MPMGEESYKKLMNLFSRMIKEQRSEIVEFAELNDPDLQKVITVHPNDEGNLVICVFTLQQWQMIQDVCLMTGKQEAEVVSGIEKENLVRKIILDPKKYPEQDLDLDF
jgi:hypothetical protein